MPVEIGLLLFPGLTQLDLTGPYEVFTRITGARVHLLWKTLGPITADSGLTLLPTTTLAESPRLDVLCVPGGPGTTPLLEDAEVLSFLTHQAERARFVTSVCTGSLVLAAAGLLDGYRAACHWTSREFLAQLGAEVSTARVVVDRNRITGGGVTAGIDFALTLAAALVDEHEARRIQLQIEYNPSPPYDAGSPESAGPALVAEVLDRASATLASRRAIVGQVARPARDR